MPNAKQFKAKDYTNPRDYETSYNKTKMQSNRKYFLAPKSSARAIVRSQRGSQRKPKAPKRIWGNVLTRTHARVIISLLAARARRNSDHHSSRNKDCVPPRSLFFALHPFQKNISSFGKSLDMESSVMYNKSTSRLGVASKGALRNVHQTDKTTPG